jgi:HlyD family secretion protein
MRRFLVVSALTLLGLSLVSCGNNNGVPAGSGFIEATSVVVSAETGGRLEALYFDEGKTIRTGDTIALIDTTTVSLKLDQAQARLGAAWTRESSARLKIEKADLDSSLARTDFLRLKNLVGKGSVNRQQYDQAENKYLQTRLARKTAGASLAGARADRKRAETEIAILEKQLGDCRPVSPLAGTVVTSYVEQGELLGVGKPLVKIARLDPVTVKIYLPPSMLTSVKLGARAEIDPEDGRTEPIAGKVSWISPEAEFTPKNVQSREARADLVYAVKITIPNPEQVLKIGMPVMVRIP